MPRISEPESVNAIITMSVFYSHDIYLSPVLYRIWFRRWGVGVFFEYKGVVASKELNLLVLLDYVSANTTKGSYVNQDRLLYTAYYQSIVILICKNLSN